MGKADLEALGFSVNVRDLGIQSGLREFHIVATPVEGGRAIESLASFDPHLVAPDLDCYFEAIAGVVSERHG